jgi:tol-pal system protein YbgF
MMKLHSVLKASIMLAFAFGAQAQVNVVESRSLAQKQAEKFYKQQQEDAAKANAELFYQLQLLQDEVMRMQGLLEEQAHEIRVLKQQRLDDYVNLDKRIAELSQQNSADSAQAAMVPAATNTVAATSANAGESGASINDIPVEPQSVDDKIAYKAAYSLIREKKFEEATAAFEAFLKKYPSSIYIPNSYYWLGELYIINEKLDKAADAFGAILKDYPDNRKYPEALYKQAKVNYELGKRDEAKTQLDSLIAQFTGKSDNTVRLAREFLAQHYP